MNAKHPELTGNFVEDSFHIAEQLDNVSRALARKAHAFLETGNEDHSSFLFEAAQCITDTTAQVRALVANETTRGLKEAEHNSATLLLGVMRMAGVDTEKASQ